MSGRIVAFTGHRPKKLGNDYDLKSPLIDKIRAEMRLRLLEIDPVSGISGLALGIDTLSALLCLELNIPLIAAIPFKGQELGWHIKSIKLYKLILSRASRVVVVSEGGYENWKFQKRNIWMVDNSTDLMSVWDGSAGGTANCIEYANKIGRNIIPIKL